MMIILMLASSITKPFTYFQIFKKEMHNIPTFLYKVTGFCDCMNTFSSSVQEISATIKVFIFPSTKNKPMHY